MAQAAIAAEPSIRIGSLTLARIYAPADSPVGLREYAPPGENAEAWTRLVSVRTFAKEKKAKSYLERVAELRTAMAHH